MDLFESVRNKNKTLSEFLRPSAINEVVGQKHLIGDKMPFRTLLETDRLNSVIMFGPPGTGKTTISRIYAGMTGSPFIQLNAALCGTADIKNAATAYLDKKPVVFIDEIHRFNKAQQDVLLPYIEDMKIKFIGATTHNPLIYIVPALRSRSMIFELKHITSDDLHGYIKYLFEQGKILEFVTKELGVRVNKVSADEKLIDYLAKSANGDVRVLLNVIETALITKFAAKDEFEGKE
ncbi:MAG TPA: AAA family ATPase, partial [Candidatus Wallbacteria bacterium]|nr:AAA family ATPase [Candidatus Wallbacteria bacterium]